MSGSDFSVRSNLLIGLGRCQASRNVYGTVPMFLKAARSPDTLSSSGFPAA